MKRFKVEGWYRYNDEKDFEWAIITIDSPTSAIEFFEDMYQEFSFYKIDIKEIV